MNGLKEIVKPLNQRINALSVRERVVLTITLLVAIFFVWGALLMDQQIAEIQNIRKEIGQQSSSITSMQLVQKSMVEQLASDPNKAEQIRLDRYLAEAARIDKELREQTLEFISPQQMIDVLKDLIQKESGLRLVSLESVKPEDPLADMEKELAGSNTSQPQAKEASKTAEPSGAYLHTLKLNFKGDYLSAMHYIQRLESLQWRFIWKSLSIQLEDYPVTNVELQLQTFGLTEGWIGV
ncbi:MAG: hypothetical protein JXA04_04765 [Gammaproteobacteria bacterium]|nr:hypothetical protein [Gammaproteobacteria bacterium]